jgi:hypothetical protein
VVWFYALGYFDKNTAEETKLSTVAPAEIEFFAESYYFLGVTSSDGSEITYSSSDESVATVSDSGYVYGVQPGDALIKATANGVEKSFVATVMQYTYYWELQVGDTVTYGDIYDKACGYLFDKSLLTISDSTVFAPVDENVSDENRVWILKQAGDAIIYIGGENDVAACVIYVTAYDEIGERKFSTSVDWYENTSIDVSETDGTAEYFTNSNFDYPETDFSNGGQIMYVSSDNSVVKVFQNGYCETYGVGKAVVTALCISVDNSVQAYRFEVDVVIPYVIIDKTVGDEITEDELDSMYGAEEIAYYAADNSEYFRTVTGGSGRAVSFVALKATGEDGTVIRAYGEEDELIMNFIVRIANADTDTDTESE